MEWMSRNRRLGSEELIVPSYSKFDPREEMPASMNPLLLSPLVGHRANGETHPLLLSPLLGNRGGGESDLKSLQLNAMLQHFLLRAAALSQHQYQYQQFQCQTKRMTPLTSLLQVSIHNLIFYHFQASIFCSIFI